MGAGARSDYHDADDVFFIPLGPRTFGVMLHFIDGLNFDRRGLSGARRFLASDVGTGSFALGSGCEFGYWDVFFAGHQLILDSFHSGGWPFYDKGLAWCKCSERWCWGVGIWIVSAATAQSCFTAAQRDFGTLVWASGANFVSEFGYSCVELHSRPRGGHGIFGLPPHCHLFGTVVRCIESSF